MSIALNTVLSVDVQLCLKFLDAARGANQPSLVPEVAAQLAENGRKCVADERGASTGIETVGGFDQTQPRHLDQVFVGHPAIPVSPGGTVGQGDVHKHDLLQESGSSRPSGPDSCLQELSSYAGTLIVGRVWRAGNNRRRGSHATTSGRGSWHGLDHVLPPKHM